MALRVVPGKCCGWYILKLSVTKHPPYLQHSSKILMLSSGDQVVILHVERNSHIFKIGHHLRNNILHTPFPPSSQTLSHHLVIFPEKFMQQHQYDFCCFSPPFNTNRDFHRSNATEEGKCQPLMEYQASSLSLLLQ